jgi:hypothetical protein
MKPSNPLYIGSEITDPEMLNQVPEDYRRLLQQVNGSILFDGGLHIRGAVLTPEWHSLRKVWVGDFALHKLFPAIENTDVPFAQDCLGDQFLLRENVVHKLDAESGEIESLRMDLETFLNRSQENPVEFLSLQPLLQFLREGGEMKPGQLLSVYPPYITKESANGVSLRAILMFDRIGFLANFARQIAGIPDGAKLESKVVNTSEGEG